MMNEGACESTGTHDATKILQYEHTVKLAPIKINSFKHCRHDCIFFIHTTMQKPLFAHVNFEMHLISENKQTKEPFMSK